MANEHKFSFTSNVIFAVSNIKIQPYCQSVKNIPANMTYIMFDFAKYLTWYSF